MFSYVDGCCPGSPTFPWARRESPSPSPDPSLRPQAPYQPPQLHTTRESSRPSPDTSSLSASSTIPSPHSWSPRLPGSSSALKRAASPAAAETSKKAPRPSTKPSAPAAAKCSIFSRSRVLQPLGLRPPQRARSPMYYHPKFRPTTDPLKQRYKNRSATPLSSPESRTTSESASPEPLQKVQKLNPPTMPCYPQVIAKTAVATSRSRSRSCPLKPNAPNSRARLERLRRLLTVTPSPSTFVVR